MRTIKVYRVECFWGSMKEEFNENEPGFMSWYKQYMEHCPKFDADHKADLNRMNIGQYHIELYDDGTYVGTAYYNTNHKYKAGDDGLAF